MSANSLELKDMLCDRILVVEDDHGLCRALVRALQPYARKIRSCASIKEADRIIEDWQPELMMLDFKLSDGDAGALLKKLSLRSPCPVIIALSGCAKPKDAFDLAHFGVRFFLQKPIELSSLESVLKRALNEKPNLAPHIRNSVGIVGLKNLESEVRHTLLKEALGRAHESRRGAAKLLRVSRQFVQHAIRKLKD